MNWLKTKLKTSLGIFDLYRKIESVKVYTENIAHILKQRTEYHLDVHHKTGSNTKVIIIGRYHKRDFIKIYDIKANDIYDIIRHCKRLEDTAKIKRVDAGFNFETVIKREIR